MGQGGTIAWLVDKILNYLEGFSGETFSERLEIRNVLLLAIGLSL
jgi:hypothetical protein